MNRKIKIKISKEGKVEVDSTVFDDCMDIADRLKELLGSMDELVEKEDSGFDSEERVKIESP